MEEKKKKSINTIIRSLHRDIGFFVIGLTIIFCFSGIILIFRDTDFLKKETVIEKQLDAQIETSKLGEALRMRHFNIDKEIGDTVYFNNGSYNKKTGMAIYSEKRLPWLVDKLNRFHKTSSRGTVHWPLTIFGILLLFLAVSSFWMFKPKTKAFKRGLYISGVGFLAAIAMIFLSGI